MWCTFQADPEIEPALLRSKAYYGNANEDLPFKPNYVIGA